MKNPQQSQLQSIKETQQIIRQNKLLAIQQSKDRKRKLSNMFKRVTDQKNLSNQEKIADVIKKPLSKFKAQRKDTRQTNPTVSQVILKNQQTQKNEVLAQLIKKSSDDPFLQRKIKNIVESDLKHLMKLNNPKSLAQSFSSSNIRSSNNIKKSVNSFVSNLSNSNGSDYNKLCKDVTIVLNKTEFNKQDFSIRSIDSSTPVRQRLMADFTENISYLNKQTEQADKFTTLRKRKYKDKIHRLQTFKQIKTKDQQSVFTPQNLQRRLTFEQHYQNEFYTPSSSLNLKDNTENLWLDIQKFNLKDSN